MAEEKRISETKLLYDPLFDKKPDIEMSGKKNLKFKIVFVIVITVCVGFSLYFSFNSISKAKYIYKPNETGFTLSQFNGQEKDICLFIDHVRDGKDTSANGQKVTEVREFCMSCNEYVQFIFIGKDVEKLEPHCFYHTKNLLAVIVDPENRFYRSEDGVLYSRDMTEIILHPMRNHEYRAGIAAGIAAPSDEDSSFAFIDALARKFGKTDKEDYEKQFAKFTEYEIPDSVVSVADACFSDCAELRYVKIPSAVRRIGSLAFFKCSGLETVFIPDGVESIGSDGFSYCGKVSYIFVPASVKEIGHHAFWDCMGIDAVYMGAADDSGISFGEKWIPKQNTKTLKTVDVVYGAERRAG